MNKRLTRTSRVRRGTELAPFLERLVTRYHRPEFLGSDPLALVHEFSDSEDREFAALFAALLAYGNVKQIQSSLRRLFNAMGGRPGHFVRYFSYPEAAAQLEGWKHRFTEAEDLLCLSWLLHQAVTASDTLEAVFAQGYCPEEPDLTSAASRFLDHLHDQPFAPWFDRDTMLAKSSFKHLVPRADRGSACKRLHLFLRWVVRPADGLDLGAWTSIPVSKLLIPVDTHVLRIGQNLGLIQGKSSSLRAAREITAALRDADSSDPVRYDFSLCRIGILRACPTTANLDACRNCELHDPCRRRSRLEKRSGKKAQR